MAQKMALILAVSWFSWGGVGNAHLVFKKAEVFLLLVCWFFALSPLWFGESGEWKSHAWHLPWWGLDKVGVTTKQPFCPIPFAAYHFLFHFSFPRHLAAFLQVCLPSIPYCPHTRMWAVEAAQLVPFARRCWGAVGVSAEQQRGGAEC